MGRFTDMFREERPAPAPPPPTPWWACVPFWMLLGALCGSALYLTVLRKAMPPPRQLGREFRQVAKDFAEAYAPARPKDDGLPQGPAADTLSAPVDPTRSRGKYVGRKGSRSLLAKRRGDEYGYKPAADAENYTHHMNTPLRFDDFEVPFWQTDMGRGIACVGSLAVFFGGLGWFLFRNINKHARTF
ncbi:MAG: hypothetical protein WC728_16765 [Elusimicrobiota bacterium]